MSGRKRKSSVMSLVGSSWACLSNISLGSWLYLWADKTILCSLLSPIEGLPLASRIPLSFELLEGESHVLHFYVPSTYHCTLLRGGTLTMFVNHVNSLICFQFHTLQWITISREAERNPESSIRGSWEFLLCSDILRSQSCKNGSLSFPTCSFVWTNHHKDPSSVQELREAPSIHWRGGAKEVRPCL